jgi:predicted transcriptional regulator
MYPEVFSVAPEASVEDAIRMMAFEGVHRLVVLEASGQLVGVITSMDVLRSLAGLPRPGERVIAVAPPR